MNGRDDTRAHWRAGRLRLLTVFLQFTRHSAVNSPLPKASRSINPLVEGVLASPASSGSSVVRTLRGKALARVRSMSQSVSARLRNASADSFERARPRETLREKGENRICRAGRRPYKR